MTTATPSRRDRLREETRREILAAGRRQLVEAGPPGISLRGIAREMGMTAPGLYRYYASLGELVVALVADIYDEASAAMESRRDARPAGDLGGRLLAVSREFRSWSVEHPAEFALIFGAPLPGLAPAGDCRGVPGGGDGSPGTGLTGPAEAAGQRFSAVFQDLFVQIWARQGVPLPADGTLARGLTGQLRRYAANAGIVLPPPAVYVFLACWVRIYGAVAMEVFGQLRWALDDGAALFETELRQLAGLLGMAEAYRPPRAARKS